MGVQVQLPLEKHFTCEANMNMLSCFVSSVFFFSFCSSWWCYETFLISLQLIVYLCPEWKKHIEQNRLKHLCLFQGQSFFNLNLFSFGQKMTHILSSVLHYMTLFKTEHEMNTSLLSLETADDKIISSQGPFSLLFFIFITTFYGTHQQLEFS